MMYGIEIKEITPTDARTIINTQQPRCLFYTKENGVYVGIDNTTGDAWTEDFKTLDACAKWLHGP